jgi:adenylosuccinate lyase
MLTAISPIDGRYASQTRPLSDYFSEYALIRYRVLVEIRYFLALCRIPLPQLKGVKESQLNELIRLTNRFDLKSAERVKEIERITHHDVKAVEYFLKEEFDRLGLSEVREFIHFGLTSQDINNTAVPLSLRHAVEQVLQPALRQLLETLEDRSRDWEGVPMLARTHGQPASPTRLGREFGVFAERLRGQLKPLAEAPFSAKFGGATGGLNAHKVSFPDIDWQAFARQFVEEDLGLKRSYPTTQIEHYDNLAGLFHAFIRINTILIDLCRDIWTYISMEYFRQKTAKGEIGSSAMPHKVNPIDFENAEGNLGVANALLGHLAEKLPISRLQRDLTDSTVLRNLGVPLGHMLIALSSLQKGMGKLLLNEVKLQEDLNENWMVVAEAIQNILRREGYPNPYETLKELTRGKPQIMEADIRAFIDQLEVDTGIKEELKAIRPDNYTGY